MNGTVAIFGVVAALALAGCATPYQEMGFVGGVAATQISSDTVQVTARVNGFTDPDVVQRYALRKAAEVTVQNGFDLFYIDDRADRTSADTVSSGYVTGNRRSVWGSSTTFQIIHPGQTVMIRMVKGPPPAPLPPGMFDAHDILKFAAAAEASSDKKDCHQVEGKIACD